MVGVCHVIHQAFVTACQIASNHGHVKMAYHKSSCKMEHEKIQKKNMPLSIPWPLGGIPSAASATALALLDASEGHPFRAAVLLGDQLQLHALMQHGLGQDWHLEAQVAMPQGAAAVSLTGDQQKVLVPGENSEGDGSIY